MSGRQNSSVEQLLDDLIDEQAAVDAVVADLGEDAWSRPTPARGWDVHDQIAHLASVDEFAARAATDPDGFRALAERSARDPKAFEAEVFAAGQSRRGSSVLAWWRQARNEAIGAIRQLDDGVRLAWFGPSMSQRSFVTARLMETWAHGLDVADALGHELAPTDRLRHIANLGVATFAWSFVVRGLEPPADPVRVELEGHTGAHWTWGPQGAPDRVTGSVLDFCLVVTQRRHIDRTTLRVDGPVANTWMRNAQAFASPATTVSPNRGLPQEEDR